MIRHCVMFRWNAEMPVAWIDEVEAALATLPTAIPTIASYSFGRDIGVNAGNFEFAVVADFATVDDYITYRDHPDHKRVVAELIVPNMPSGRRCSSTWADGSARLFGRIAFAQRTILVHCSVSVRASIRHPSAVRTYES